MKETPRCVGELYLVQLSHLLCRRNVIGTLNHLLCRKVLCTLTHLLCRGWARLHWRECTLGILSRRVAPIRMHLGYSIPHQDLLWLLCTHFSSQHSNLLMTSCPRSSALRMCQQLECNPNRTLGTKEVSSAPAVGCWEQRWPAGIELGTVWDGCTHSVADTDSHLDFCLPWTRQGILCGTSSPAMGAKDKALWALKFDLHWELVSWKIHW